MIKKSIKYIILLLIFSNEFLEAETIKLTPLKIDFNGVVAYDNKLLAYADDGFYAISTDNGISWEYKILAKKLSIQKLINKGNEFFGFTDKNKFIKFKNEFDNIEYYELESDTLEPVNNNSLFIDKPLDILLDDEFIYIRTFDKIIKYDINFREISRYQSTLFVRRYSASGYNFIGVASNLLLSDEYIFGQFFGELLVLDKNLDSIETLKLGENINTDKGFVRDVYYENNNYFFLLDSVNYGVLLFRTDDLLNTNSWYKVNNDFIFSGSNFLKSEKDFLYLINIYEVIKMNLNTGKNEYSNVKLWNKYKIHFASLGLNQTLLNNQSIISIGKRSTILKSEDLGETWDVNSYQGFPSLIVGDSILININQGGSFYYSHSKNGISNFQVPEIKDSLNDLAFKKFTSLNYFHFDDTGKGFITGNMEAINYDNFCYTYDYGKTFTCYRNNQTDYLVTNTTKVTKLDDGYIYGQSRWIRPPGYDSPIYYNEYITVAEDMLSAERVRDSHKVVYHVLAKESSKEFEIIAHTKKDSILPRQRLEIIKTEDGGHNFPITLHSINNYSQNVEVYEHTKDSIFILTYGEDYIAGEPYNNRLYLYDRLKNEVDTLFTEKEKKYEIFKIIKYKNKFLLVTDSLILIGNYNLREWNQLDWSLSESPKFYDALAKGNIAYISYEDERYPRGYYKLEIDGISRVESPKTALYGGLAYPNPATDKIRLPLTWENTDEMSINSVKVYNIYGNELQEANIKLVKNSNYLGEIEWDCTGIRPGIYYIVVSHGNNQLNTKVSIIR